MRGIHQSPVNSPHKWPVTRKMFPFDNVILRMHYIYSWCNGQHLLELGLFDPIVTFQHIHWRHPKANPRWRDRWLTPYKKIAIWGWQTPQLPRTERPLIRIIRSWENCSYNKTQDSCGVMSGKIKLGEADYTVFWETLLFMSNILCQISWKGPFDAYSLFKVFCCCWKMRKTFTTNVFLRIW